MKEQRRQGLQQQKMYQQPRRPLQMKPAPRSRQGHSGSIGGGDHALGQARWPGNPGGAGLGSGPEPAFFKGLKNCFCNA